MIHKFYGKLSNSQKAISQGLMYIKKPLKEREGMLFDMSKCDFHKFWMKNTYIPLDVIFLNSNLKVIGYVTNNQPLSLESISINKKSRYILEINANSVNKFNIRINDYIEFNII